MHKELAPITLRQVATPMPCGHSEDHWHLFVGKLAVAHVPDPSAFMVAWQVADLTRVILEMK